MKRYLAIPVLAAAFAAGFAACKQGEGERCQLDDDCASGLVCNQAIGACASDNEQSNPIDALPPIDAPDAPLPPDAPDEPIDAR